MDIVDEAKEYFREVYCEKHDQGYLIRLPNKDADANLPMSSPPDLCLAGKTCLGWHEEYGLVTVVYTTAEKTEISEIYGLTDQRSWDRYAGGWDVKYFSSEIYDNSGKRLDEICARVSKFMGREESNDDIVNLWNPVFGPDGTFFTHNK